LRILPFLEETALAQSWNYATNVAGNGSPSASASSRPWITPPPAAASPADTNIRGFYCPSRRNGIRGGYDDAALLATTWTGGGTDYGGCVGRHKAYADNAAHSVEDAALQKSAGFVPTGTYIVADDCGATRWGVFGRVNVSTSIREIRDGLSHTIVTGELQRGEYSYTASNTATNPYHDGWAIGGDATGFTTGYFGPLSSHPAGSVYKTPYPMNNGNFRSPGSDHAGGANFGFGDGAVRFISSSTDPSVFALLGSMADGVPASLEW
jgi:prepilin-type processing-associated H-X9-DG protein